MANYNWSALNDGTVFGSGGANPPSFNPLVDQLIFDDAGISAAGVSFQFVSGSTSTFSFGGKTVTLNAAPEALTTTNVTFADGSKLVVGDDTTGTGNDSIGNTLTGGAGNDQLVGLGGDDTLDGGAGADLLTGGTENDTYFVDRAGDVVVEAAAGGTDTVLSSATYALGGEVEHLTLIGAASVGDTLTLLANDGPATLARVASASSPLVGSWYFVDVDDAIALTFLADGAYLLAEEGVPDAFGGPGMERGTYTWDPVSGAFSSVTTVDTSGNWGISHDLVTNAQVSGDTLTVIAEDGIFEFARVVDAVNPLVGGWFFGEEGVSLVAITILPDGTYLHAEDNNPAISPGGQDGFESGTYAWDSSTNAFSSVTVVDTNGEWGLSHSFITEGNVDGPDATGNGLANRLIGNNSSNVLDGSAGNDTLVGGPGRDTLDGGAGADSMVGGAGDDTYIFDNSGDVAVEAAGQGSDTIITSVGVSFLAEFVERVKYVGTGGTGIIGNELDNVIGARHVASMTYGGGSGNDTISYVEETVALTINLAGNQTIGNSITNTSFGFENAEGGLGDDSMIGTTAANVLNGMGGADTMTGGTGSDTYYVDDAGDAVVETTNNPGGLVLPGAGSGVGAGLLGGVFDTITDTVIAAINFSLVNLEYVERLTLDGAATTGTGNALANELEGNALDNMLSGLDGNDTLDGAGGSDTLDGGAGNDTAVFASLSAGVIALLASGTAVGGLSGADSMSGIENVTGTAFNDTIAGDGNANVLDGGRGLDSLDGGDGDDSYVAGATGAAGASRIVFVQDIVVEDAAQGLDTVRSNASFLLPAEVENLVLTGAAMWRPYSGTGNDLANLIEGEGAARHRLFGNGGDDTLIGGSGADTLAGGAGADVFLFDTAPSADTVLDFTSGTDHINLENAIFTAFGATGPVNAVNVQLGLESAINATSGNAGDGQDYLKYATDTGHLYYDADGTAAGGLSLIATVYSNGTTSATILSTQDIVIV